MASDGDLAGVRTWYDERGRDEPPNTARGSGAV